MSDYELITIMLKMLTLVVTLLIAYIDNTKSNRPNCQGKGYFL